ncbi:MAG: mechanosensitive ion channel family protein [Bacteroidota bacterium]
MDTKFFDLEKHLQHFIRLLVEYSPRLLAAGFVLFFGLWLIRRFSKIASKAMDKKELDVSLRTFLISLLSVGLKVILIVTVAGMIGIGTTSFVTILGAAGLAVGLALQGSLSNFAGGVLLLIFKPYKVDDMIEVQGQIGRVSEIQVFNTILITSDLKTIILPNGVVSNGTIINISKNGLLRGNVDIIVSTNNDIDALKELLMKEILKHPLIIKETLPEIVAVKIIDNAVTLSIKAYGKSDDISQINSDIILISKKVFEQHNIATPIQMRLVQNI